MKTTNTTLSASEARQRTRPPLFGNPRILCVSALLIALSIVLGKYLAISTPVFRFSLENLPILMAGIFFGPVIGGLVGGVADIIGCLQVGYTINPLITLGGVLVGVLSGTIALCFSRKDRGLSVPTIIAAVAAAHIVGSMIVKTWGLAWFTDVPFETLLWRVPLYIVTGALEGAVLVLLCRNKLFMGEMERLLYGHRRRKGGR